MAFAGRVSGLFKRGLNHNSASSFVPISSIVTRARNGPTYRLFVGGVFLFISVKLSVVGILLNFNFSNFYAKVLARESMNRHFLRPFLCLGILSKVNSSCLLIFLLSKTCQ